MTEVIPAEATPNNMDLDLPLPVPADVQAFDTITQQAGYVGVTPQGFYTLGKPTAPVTLEEIGSFSCPVCQAFFRDVTKNLVPYLEQGKLRYVFIPVNNYGKFEASSLTRTALCAGQQGQFWRMHNALYEWLDSASSEIESATFPLRAAQALGLDQAQFSMCLQAPSTTAIVMAAEAEATRRAIQGTPSLYINGRPFTDGAPTFESIRNRIELALQGR
jgi:protein-disulfide isomerase